MIEATGALVLARQAIRRDRILLAVWIGVLLLLCYASAAATQGLYHSTADRVSAAAAINSTPATVALYGPILDTSSTGELAMLKLTVLYAMFVAVLFATLVRRHTRVDEERGIAEMLGATPVGRDAAYVAALLESAAGCLVLGFGAALAAMAGGLPAIGSTLFALSWVGTGLVGVGVAAVAAQLSASARTCGAAAIATVVASFALRAAGDVAWHPLVWLSPLGWNTQLRAWSHPRPWVLALYLVTTLVLLAAAALLRRRRDLGAGLMAARPGPRHGARWLNSPLGLAWRLQRTSVAIWTVAMLVMGTLAGAVVPAATKLLQSTSASDALTRLGGTAGAADALIAVELQLMAYAATCFGILAATHAAEDEDAGRTEAVQATAVARVAPWLASAAIGILGTVWIMVLAGLTLSVGAGRPIGHLLLAGLADSPAAVVTVALTLLLLGVASRRAGLGWALLAGFALLGVIADLLTMPRWVSGVSPYQHLAQNPSAISWSAPLVLTLLAAGVLVLGRRAYAVRDAR